MDDVERRRKEEEDLNNAFSEGQYGFADGGATKEDIYNAQFADDEDVEDDTMQVIPKNTGTICVYHSRQLHEIKHITEGVRWSLVIKIDADVINEKQTII